MGEVLAIVDAAKQTGMGIALAGDLQQRVRGRPRCADSTPNFIRPMPSTIMPAMSKKLMLKNSNR